MFTLVYLRHDFFLSPINFYASGYIFLTKSVKATFNCHVIKYIKKLIDIPFDFMQDVGKMAINGVSHLKQWIYMLYLICINVYMYCILT